MPGWIAFLLPWALKLVAKIGLPAVEAKWPALKPIIDEVLQIIGGVSSATPGAPVPAPSAHLIAAADHYNQRAGNTYAKA